MMSHHLNPNQTTYEELHAKSNKPANTSLTFSVGREPRPAGFFSNFETQTVPRHVPKPECFSHRKNEREEVEGDGKSLNSATLGFLDCITTDSCSNALRCDEGQTDRQFKMICLP
jgi:hypothetical protein